MKKIAFITPSVYTFGGEQRVLSMIANELSKEYDVTIYTTDELTARENSPFPLEDSIHVKHFISKTGFVDWNLRKIIRVLNRKTGCFSGKRFAAMMCEMYHPKAKRMELVKDINDEGYDYVVAVSGHNSILLGMIADEISAKTIGWQHNSYEAYFNTPGLYYWNQFEMFSLAVKKLDRCFVLNDYIAGKYLENFGVKCDVFYNPRSFKSKEKAPLTEPLFVACGEFNYRKGFDYLIEAFNMYVKKENKVSVPWKLLMLGDGATRPQIEKMIETYGLKERVILKGNVKNVKEYMMKASCFVLSSRWEGFPMVGTEALEMGLPTVAFDITAMQPLVTDGKEGLLVKAYDCEAFADAMLKVAQDEDLRVQLGKCAAEKSKEFSMETIIAQWKDIFD